MRDGGDAALSPAELAHLFAESREDVSETVTGIDTRGDALAAQSHSLAEAFERDGDAVEREQLDALATEALDGLADLERLASDLHALLVAVEEARGYMEQTE
jgi:hypothetical protein